MSDLADWLAELGLEQYASVLARNDVDLQVLPELTEADLAALGLSLGHRKKLLRAIRRPDAAVAPPERPEYADPSRYTPDHLAERIRAARGLLAGERKQVTVLFADIKGSLELIEGSDPEQAHAILAVAIDVMMDAVHRYEGTVNKVLGDGIMALFGAPIAHEDHAVRACYAALAMLRAMAEKAGEIRRDHGVEAQVRVGLHSGEVVVRGIGNDLAMDYDAIGPTTHLAGRMEQLALPGTARLSAETARLAEGFIETRSLGVAPVKGLKEPVELFELSGAMEGRSRFQAAVARGLSRFVGRDTEMAALARALARAGEGQGQIFATVGEPGLGKSRLCYEFARGPQLEGWLVLSAGSVSYGKATAYLPVVDLLKGYFRIESRDAPRMIREKVIGKLLALDEATRPLLPPILNLLDVAPEDDAWEGLDPAQRRRRTIEAVRALLLRESREQPLLVVFEDLHWIDSETQAVLDVLVDSLPTVRMLLLVNYRPEYRHTWGSRSYYSQRRLEPLPQESAEALLEALLGADGSLAPLKRLLIRRTEGNPFFVEESARALAESGALAGAPGAHRLTEDVGTLEIPATVQGVLAARIDRVSAAHKRLLQTAAVVGKDVPFALLQAVVEEPEDRLNAGLAALQRAEFLYETRLFPEREFSFKHALTHEVAYGSLLSEGRRGLHRSIAEAMERLYADRLAEHWERLAHHFSEAGLAEQAVTYWQRAGERAVERSAYPEAIDHLRRGLALTGELPDHPGRAERELALLLALGVPLQGTRGAGSIEVGELYMQARTLCRGIDDRGTYFTVLWGLWRFYRQGADFQQARRLLAEMFTLAEDRQDPALLLEAYHAGWTTSFFTGDFGDVRRQVDEALALFDTQRHVGLAFRFGGHDPRVCGLSMDAEAQWVQGSPDGALRRMEEALALARELDHPSTLALAVDQAAQISHLRGDLATLSRQAEALVELAEEHGYDEYLATGRLLRNWALFAQGRPSEDPDMWGARESGHRVAGQEIEEAHFRAIVAEALSRQGALDEALAVVEATLGETAGHETRYWDADLLRLKGEVLLARDAAAAEPAEACFREAIAVTGHQGAKSLELRAATSLARLWCHHGKTAAARDLLSPLYASFSEGFDTRDLMEARALLETL